MAKRFPAAKELRLLKQVFDTCLISEKNKTLEGRGWRMAKLDPSLGDFFVVCLLLGMKLRTLHSPGRYCATVISPALKPGQFIVNY